MDRLTANYATADLATSSRRRGALSAEQEMFPFSDSLERRIDEMAKNRSANDDLSLSRPTVVGSYVFRLSTCLCSYKARYPRLTRPV